MTAQRQSRVKRHGSRQPTISALMKRLRSLCAEWPEFRHAFAKGASEKQSRDFVRRLGRKVPTQFSKLYASYNGSRDRDVYGYYRLLSLREIAECKDMQDRLENDGVFDLWRPGTWWNTSWLPFLWENGNYFCIDLSAKPVPHVVEFFTHDHRRNIVFPSFQAWLHTFVATLEAAPSLSEDDLVDFFGSRKASSIRRSLYPGFPIRRRAKQASRPRHARPKLSLNRNYFERGPYNWCIDRAGALVQTSYGRAYSKTVKTKEFPDADAAKRHVER